MEDIVLEGFPQASQEHRMTLAWAPPWNPLEHFSTANTVGARSLMENALLPCRTDSDWCSLSWSSGYNLSTSMPSRSGYSCSCNGVDTGTSTISNEALCSHLVDNTETMRPPLMPNNPVQLSPGKVGPSSINAIPTRLSSYDSGSGSRSGCTRLLYILCL
jgi:hypothetical protein